MEPERDDCGAKAAAADYGLCPMPTPDQELHSMLSWIRMKNQVPKSRLP